MDLSAGQAVTWSAGIAACAMLATWAVQLRTRNAGPVDLVWTLAVGGTAVLHAATSNGWLPRRLLVAGLASLWSVRLAWHLARRLAQGGEDGRYAELRRTLGTRANAWFLVFFLGQALLVVGLGLVFLVLCRAPLVGWRASDAVALALFGLALGGEALADRQLARWRANPANRGRVCRTGLWRHSRHPNYFFEWLHWLVYPVLGLGLEQGWLLWAAPLAMLTLVLRVTGIPPTEAQALRSRGDDYREYQRTTNAFFPGPVHGLDRPTPR